MIQDYSFSKKKDRYYFAEKTQKASKVTARKPFMAEVYKKIIEFVSSQDADLSSG